MTLITKSSLRIASVLAAGVMLSGCNYNHANDGVRGGPQAVHPSASALAQGTYVAQTPVAAVPTTTCGGPGQAACYAPSANDGSQPIID